MNAFLILLEVLVKCLISLTTGAGTGTLVFGIALFIEGVSDFGSSGPPPAAIAVGAGGGLLTMALTMLILFAGPFSRRRWFIVSSEPRDVPSKKWS